jgi:hypothetical protein
MFHLRSPEGARLRSASLAKHYHSVFDEAAGRRVVLNA